MELQQDSDSVEKAYEWLEDELTGTAGSFSSRSSTRASAGMTGSISICSSDTDG